MKQKSENKNSRKRVSKWVYRILMLIAACVFAYSAFQLGSIYYANYKEKQETEELKGSIKTVKKNGQEELRSVDFEKLREINPDVIAWIMIPDTDISYAVVQGTDNDYYLSHTVAKESNYAGAIFLDANASADFSDMNSFIYGHSTKHGTMFTNLEMFRDQAFADAHRYVYLFTPDKQYRCTIYSMYSTSYDSDSYLLGNTNSATQGAYLEMVKGLSLFDYGVEASAQDRLITLSTCSYEDGVANERRYLLHAVLEEWSGVDER